GRTCQYLEAFAAIRCAALRLLQHDDTAEDLILVPWRTLTRRSADVRAAIWCVTLTILLIGTGIHRPVLFDLVMIVCEANLGRAAVGEIAAGSLGIRPHQSGIELRVPLVMAVPVITFLVRS